MPTIGHHVLRYVDIAPAFARQLLHLPALPEAILVREFVTSTFILVFLLLMVGRLVRPWISGIRGLIARIQRAGAESETKR